MKKLTPIVVFGFISLTGWGSQLNFDDPGALQAVIRQARPSEKTFSGNLFNKNFDQIPYTEQVKNAYFHGCNHYPYYLHSDSNCESLKIS